MRQGGHFGKHGRVEVKVVGIALLLGRPNLAFEEAREQKSASSSPLLQALG
jgi:hypothetical protein